MQALSQRFRSPLLAAESEPETPRRRGRRLLFLGAELAVVASVLWLASLPPDHRLKQGLWFAHDTVWLPLRGFAYTFFYPYSWVWCLLLLLLIVLAVTSWLVTWPPSLRIHLAMARRRLRQVNGDSPLERWLSSGRRWPKGRGQLLVAVLQQERRWALEAWEHGVVDGTRARHLTLLEARIRRRGHQRREALALLLAWALRYALLTQNLKKPSEDSPEGDDESEDKGDAPDPLTEIRQLAQELAEGDGFENLSADLKVLLDPRPQRLECHTELVDRIDRRRQQLEQERRRLELERLERLAGARPLGWNDFSLERSTSRRTEWDESTVRQALDLALLAALQFRAPEVALATLESVEGWLFLRQAFAAKNLARTAGVDLPTPFDHRLCAQLLADDPTLLGELEAAAGRSSKVLSSLEPWSLRWRQAELAIAAAVPNPPSRQRRSETAP